METKQLSKYQIFWVFLQPIGGSATKSDLDKINKVVGAGRFHMCCDYIATFRPNQEKAKQILNSLKSITKLSKRYNLTGDVGLEHLIDDNISKKVSMTEYFKGKTKEQLKEVL